MPTSNDDTNLVATRLRTTRRMAGLSQAQVAKILGLHRPSISEMEAGRRKVSVEELAKLAKIYAVDIEWLAGSEPETQSGKVLRLRGKGVKPVRGGMQGDILCKIIVETPVKLNKKQKALLHDLEETLSSDSAKHNPKLNAWLEKMKQFLKKQGS